MLRRKATMRVMELVLGLVIIVHLRQDGHAAVPTAAVVMFLELAQEAADNARNDHGMLGGQIATIAARCVQGRLQNPFDVDLVAAACNQFSQPNRCFVCSVLTRVALAAGFDPKKL